MTRYLAVDIGGTQIKYGLVDQAGQLLEQHKMDTQAHLGGPHILATVKDLVGKYKESSGIDGVAISSAGMVDHEKGEIFYSGPQIPNYAGTKFKAVIEQTFGLPCEMENDVNCAGLAEGISGAGKDAKIVLCLTVGTGIGGCLLINKEIYHGFSNAACEVGYIPLAEGEFQSIASTKALVSYVAELHEDSEGEWDGFRVFAEAKAGNRICQAAIHRLVDTLCKGIASICYVVNPEVIVLGGGIMGQKEYLEPKLQMSLKQHLLPHLSEKTKLLFAEHENAAGMLGAFYHFIQKHPLDKVSYD
ncbi:ROK family protein [Streptococcus suis]|uniref:Glucose kinase n=1 Tax=Streptococcus suis R61 TaxID=996306 RepID=A0AA87K4S0_STRSU|nr:ROK family protein [Streptococcus suis]AER44188.1 putative glucose kinase [Streptococcus suis A7]ATZ03706.1 ROK family protein [Streptococcus suis]EHC03827.1 putative glucose kinase [Streptococcus suis R61]MBY5001792.1 ROK family protein [Streptococcus suis]MBY5012700.1 ROK family protein [Streptococcus suis]